MSLSFKTARDVYLCHALSAITELSVKLSDQDDGSHSSRRCILACWTVLRYIRAAQSACGVLGLVAIDRSEGYLLLCMRDLRAGEDSECYGMAPSSTVGLCYANALNRQCCGDFQLQELWTFAAKRLETIIKLERGHFSTKDVQRSERSWLLPLREREVLMAKAANFDSKEKAAQQEGKVWNSKFFGRAAHCCRLALVCAQICSLHNTGRLFPGTTKAMSHQMKHQCLAVQAAVTMIERNLSICDTADAPHSVEVQLLAERAAQRLERAVNLVATRPTVTVDTGRGRVVSNDGTSDLAEKQREADILVKNATALANLACALSAVAIQLRKLRATATAVRYTELLVSAAAGRLQALTTEITASASNRGSHAVHVQDQARLAAAIAQLAEELRDVERTVTWEERAVQRFLTEADKENRETSDAHPHIAECWTLAATHMNLALDARGSANTEADVKRATYHRACAKLCENLAAGTFGDSACYFAKAGLTPCSRAKELWKEAARELVGMGIPVLQCLQDAANDSTDAVTVVAMTTPTDFEAAQLRFATACADYAAALEVTMSQSTDEDVAGHTRTEGVTVASDAPAAEQELVVGASYADVALQMRLLLVQVERAILAQAVTDKGVQRLTDLLHHVRSLLADTLLLSQTLQEPPQVYPEDHLLYEPALSAEATHQRHQLLRWLCRTAVECCEIFQLVIEAQRLNSTLATRGHKTVTCIVAALQLAESVRWYVLDGNGYHNVYTVETPEQVLLYQVLCQRSLTALRLALSDQPLAHALMVRAVQQHLDSQLQRPPALAVDISNALVCRAWQLTSMSTVPADLLLAAPLHERQHDQVKLQDNTEAHVKQATHQIALDDGRTQTASEVALRKRAIAYYAHVIMCHKVLIQADIRGSGLRLPESCARAWQAASWCDLALEALRGGRSDVAALYQRAAGLVVVETNIYWLERMNAADLQALQVGFKAVKWFVNAAAALVAGDLSLHERWLHAAGATAALVTTIKCDDYVKPALGRQYTDAALQRADQLAAQAGTLQASAGSEERQERTERCCVMH
jgi:hypothetical protein